MSAAEINIRMPFSWQQLEKALPMKPKTMLGLAAATAVVASGAAMYYAHKTELIRKARATLTSSLRTMQYFSAASDASSEVRVAHIVAADLKAYLTSTNEELPQGLKQLLKLVSSPDVLETIGGVTATVTKNSEKSDASPATATESPRADVILAQAVVRACQHQESRDILIEKGTSVAETLACKVVETQQKTTPHMLQSILQTMTEEKYREAMETLCATVLSGILQGVRTARCSRRSSSSRGFREPGWDTTPTSTRVRPALQAIETAQLGTENALVNRNGAVLSRKDDTKRLSNGGGLDGTPLAYVSAEQQVQLVSALAANDDVRFLLKDVLCSVASVVVETTFYCFGDMLSLRRLHPEQLTSPVTRKLRIMWDNRWETLSSLDSTHMLIGGGASVLGAYSYMLLGFYTWLLAMTLLAAAVLLPHQRNALLLAIKERYAGE
eukprot:scaffold3443_cov404-Prasinococcus_capsulatus_cf.AAC.19